MPLLAVQRCGLGQLRRIVRHDLNEPRTTYLSPPGRMIPIRRKLSLLRHARTGPQSRGIAMILGECGLSLKLCPERGLETVPPDFDLFLRCTHSAQPISG